MEVSEERERAMTEQNIREAFARDGYVAPLSAMSEGEAAAYRAQQSSWESSRNRNRSSELVLELAREAFWRDLAPERMVGLFSRSSLARRQVVAPDQSR